MWSLNSRLKGGFRNGKCPSICPFVCHKKLLKIVTYDHVRQNHRRIRITLTVRRGVAVARKPRICHPRYDTVKSGFFGQGAFIWKCTGAVEIFHRDMSSRTSKLQPIAYMISHSRADIIERYIDTSSIACVTHQLGAYKSSTGSFFWTFDMSEGQNRGE